MKIGDLVVCYPIPDGDFTQVSTPGIIVGFNKKGEGGKEFIHVLTNGTVNIYLSHDVELL